MKIHKEENMKLLIASDIHGSAYYCKKLLDVYEKNAPAIRLYEKFGFCYIDTVDLGYSDYGLEKFKLYQRILQ